MIRHRQETPHSHLLDRASFSMCAPQFRNSITEERIIPEPLKHYTMPIRVNPAKATLEWSDFHEVAKIPGPAIARAGYASSFAPARIPRRVVEKKFLLPENLTIRIHVAASVERSADKTSALLAHEQLHYHVGVMCARALCRELQGLSAKSYNKLMAAYRKLIRTHLSTRAGAIQRAYDRQTNHGLISGKQQEWEAAMAECLAKPSLTRLMGLPL